MTDGGIDVNPTHAEKGNGARAILNHTCLNSAESDIEL